MFQNYSFQLLLSKIINFPKIDFKGINYFFYQFNFILILSKLYYKFKFKILLV